MSIQVNDFQWKPGKNDAEYIKLLESSRDEWQKIAQKAIAKLKALSKAQEPVEPVVDKNISTGESEDPWGRLFFCGACGKRINEKYDPDEDDKYCKHCGRAVKWE